MHFPLISAMFFNTAMKMTILEMGVGFIQRSMNKKTFIDEKIMLP